MPIPFLHPNSSCSPLLWCSEQTLEWRTNRMANKANNRVDKWTMTVSMPSSIHGFQQQRPRSHFPPMCFMNSRVQHAVKVAFPAIESYLHSVAPTKEVLRVERLVDDANEVDNKFQGHGTLFTIHRRGVGKTRGWRRGIVLPVTRAETRQAGPLLQSLEYLTLHVCSRLSFRLIKCHGEEYRPSIVL
ncbi:hypothetical protein L873DRAFT_936741 [Choiromyces venosus 120613-1]|uniref:Uncharacterized protein n=1 Tax=Choiromyces venosus 120613-1 TaxID=1336337 RepID=A0A3N4JPR7_9PEZI|nr:hypothetical protein L873DRAFT_936741 [Choiromyces venosus 120613-1]